uniref:Apolipoprotein Db n=1 Tax=Scophthalmus maximus TaxID=52904 RepID=A0A8D3DBH9_SCOMX
MTKKMSAASLLLLLLPLVSAQTYHWGPCPTAKVQPNFNLQQYLGRWYEIARLPASFERGTCIQANYALREDGTIRVLNSGLEEPAKLGVSFSYFSPYGQYWVLTSDYTSLSVVYSCTDILRIFHIDFAWILGRSRILPPETIRYAKNLMIGEGIDLSRMKFTNQTGCRDD